MNLKIENARNWFIQALYDFGASKSNFEDGYYAQACFWAQQAGEKSVKAILFAQGERIVIGHSIRELLLKVKDIQISEEIINAGTELDKFYIPPRYPNALPGGYPSEFYDENSARFAIVSALKILKFIRVYLKEKFSIDVSEHWNKNVGEEDETK